MGEPRACRHGRGFTVLEVLVVLGLLGVAAVFSANAVLSDATARTAAGEAADFAAAMRCLEEHYAEHGVWPGQQLLLEARQQLAAAAVQESRVGGDLGAAQTSRRQAGAKKQSAILNLRRVCSEWADRVDEARVRIEVSAAADDFFAYQLCLEQPNPAIAWQVRQAHPWSWCASGPDCGGESVCVLLSPPARHAALRAWRTRGRGGMRVEMAGEDLVLSDRTNVDYLRFQPSEGDLDCEPCAEEDESAVRMNQDGKLLRCSSGSWVALRNNRGALLDIWPAMRTQRGAGGQWASCGPVSRPDWNGANRSLCPTSQPFNPRLRLDAEALDDDAWRNWRDNFCPNILGGEVIEVPIPQASVYYRAQLLALGVDVDIARFPAPHTSPGSIERVALCLGTDDGASCLETDG